MQFLSIYLHIPFCAHRCSYCAFNIYTDHLHLSGPYLAALWQEMALLGQKQAVHTLYIGGGTPSLLRLDEVAFLMEGIHHHFKLTQNCEITFEINPKTIDGAYLAGLRDLGINRLSVGMQAAQSEILQLFERDHLLDDTLSLVEAAKGVGLDNISLDLIYGVPQQSLAQWEETLDIALAMQPAHFSLYALQLESGTSLSRRVKKGLLPEADEDRVADMYELACKKLSAYPHYEISSWGLESRHNLQYWLNLPYLGLGAGAHGYIKPIRTINTMRPERYIKRLQAEAPPLPYPRHAATQSYEQLSPDQTMFETIMLALRLLERGLSIPEFEARFGVSFEARYGEIVARMVARGWLTQVGSRLLLSPSAWFISNQVLAEFWLEEN